ncbi:lipoxygenase family protein [Sorangium sp. So ce233]|uniref:lipoxygenase family protein n=1 Tax=Sorangium sp. So ce233 TaxID=3133290 RepID=UPI003F5E0261
MSLFDVPVLPQNDTPENREKRAQALVQQQTLYRYDYPSIVGGLPMAATPIPVDLSLDWSLQVAGVAIALGENLVSILLPNTLSFDVQIPIVLGQSGFSDRSEAQPRGEVVNPDPHVLKSDPELVKRAIELHGFLSEQREKLGKLAERAHAQKSPQPPDPLSLVRRAEADVAPVLPTELSKVFPAAPRKAPSKAPSTTTEAAAGTEVTDARDIGQWLADLVKGILDFYLSVVGLMGRAGDLQQYAAQFRKVPLPPSAGVSQTDEFFAALRVAGPNAMILRRATPADLAAFPVTDERFASVTGERGATVQEAASAGRIYIVDYSALTSLDPGTNPQQKYVWAPKALFYVPAAGSGRRSLRPLAIQTGQDAQSPIFYPSDDVSWSLAKLVVNIADGNYHELISHLGLTHLLTEPFVLATARQLDPTHPLNLLLTPHFAGTLLINYAAQTSLITPGGPVDLLLTGASASLNALAASAVQEVLYNQTFLPQALAARGVDSKEALPDYPYRDDALTIWNAIHDWVSDYVGIYYKSDGDVAGDYELQAWVQELVTAGHIQDIGEGAPGAAAKIKTVGYLSTLLTQVIFTASAQHAAVNFPQRTIMSYTPALPLAGFAPFPAPAGAPATQVLDVLAPLGESFLQQAVLGGLGAVYHTVLGQYGGQFSDLRARAALATFQKRLQVIEEQINLANGLGERTAYSTLLPSAIPQSINI